MSPYKLIFGKACHFLVELEHEENRALQKLNFDMKACGERRMLQLNQFDEFRLIAYINACYTRCKPNCSITSSFSHGVLRKGTRFDNSRLKLFLGV